MYSTSPQHQAPEKVLPAVAKNQPPSARENTRDNVLHAVLTHGPVSAATIGTQLNLTAAAVRRHLDALEEDGLVEVKSIAGSRGAGRPSRRYVVTHQGQSHLGDDYYELAHRAVTLIHQASGDEGVRTLANQHFANVEKRFQETVSSQADLVERIRTLTKVLDEEGFAASTRRAGRVGKVTTLRAAQICQGHCPIQELAADFPQFCEEETELFARLLDVDVRRLSTLPTGGHVCTTHVPLGRKAHASLTAHTAQAGRPTGS